ncbi:MAG: hypothetical protein KDA54_01625 [Phycisphaerales bacterium]|nr:hypothetical protein [Phycisphaerales bacterium]
MKTFNDQSGNTWTVQINVNAIKRVRDLLDVNLLDIVEGKLIDRLIGDPILLCDVLYVLCKPEADERNITDEQFGRAMAGDAIEHATKAVLEELVGFSPNPRDRATMTKVLEKTWQVMDKARDMIEAKLDSGELDRIAEQALQTANDSFGPAPELSESTQDLSHWPS